jgi:hypothetical protein
MAGRADFTQWAFGEMGNVLALSTQLTAMPLQAAGGSSEKAGFPFELPSTPLPTGTDNQLALLRDQLNKSAQYRADIKSKHMPDSDQKMLLDDLNQADTSISQKLG